jgi:hypothetical protein
MRSLSARRPGFTVAARPARRLLTMGQFPLTSLRLIKPEIHSKNKLLLLLNLGLSGGPWVF